MTCRSFQRDRSAAARHGVAASELAVCLPVIVLLVLAMIEACTMIFLKQSLTVAAYEGTRAALVPGATSADVRAVCNQILADRRVKGGSVTITPSDIAVLNPGEYVDVVVSAPCTGNTVVPNKFFGGKTLSATGSMMIEY